MLRIPRPSSQRSDSGLTLVELLVAISITAILGTVLVRVAADASQSMQYQIESVKNAQSTIRFAQAMRYDIAGSTDVYAFGSASDYSNTGPKDPNLLCSTWRSESTEIRKYHPLATARADARWTNPQNASTSGFVRTLVSIKIRELIYDRADPKDDTWFDSRNIWAGYEIRSARPNSADRPNRFYLWRVVCDSSSSGQPLPDIQSEERMLDLGEVLPATVSGVVALTCFADVTLEATKCPLAGLPSASGSTTARFNAYTFAVPYTPPPAGKEATKDSLKRLEPLSANDEANSLLQRMTRRINS